MNKIVDGKKIGRDRDKKVRGTRKIGEALIYIIADSEVNQMIAQETMDKLSSELKLTEEEKKRSFYSERSDRKGTVAIDYYFKNEVRAVVGLFKESGILEKNSKRNIWQKADKPEDELLELYVEYLDKNQREWGGTLAELRLSILETLKTFDGVLLIEDIYEQVFIDFENELLNKNNNKFEKDFKESIRVLKRNEQINIVENKVYLK